MANKNPIINIEVNETGDAYIVTYCDGSTAILPCIDCGGGTTTPPTIPDNGRTRCFKVGNMAKKLKDQFVDLIKTPAAGQHMDQTPQSTALATYELGLWFARWSIPVTYFYNLNVWMISENDPVDWYNAVDGGWAVPSGYTCLANYIECCLPEDQVLSDDFFNCLYANLLAGELPCSAEAPQDQSAYRMLARYMQAFGNDYWREQFLIAISTSIATNPVDCNLFDPCEGSTVGCPPDASEYAVKIYDWDSPNWSGTTSQNCYGSGNYDPCAPFNSRLGVEPELLFSTPICIRSMSLSYAGNSFTNTSTAELWVNDTLWGTLGSMTGVTKCFPVNGFSKTVQFNPTLENVLKLRVKFINLSGSNHAYGLDLHCLRLEQYPTV